MTKKVKQSELLETIPIKEEKVLVSWKAKSRPYQKKDRDFWVTALSAVGLVCVVLFVIGEGGLIAAVLSLVFLYYVLTTVEADQVEYKITSKGVYLPGAEQRIDWDYLISYFFAEKWGFEILKINTSLFNFPVIRLVVPQNKKKEIKKNIKKYLPAGKESISISNKISNWVYDHLPFEVKTPSKSS